MTVADITRETVRIPVESEAVIGDLVVPAQATGIVLFAHGSGSSRFSERNRLVAEHMNNGGFATLLFDLLTPSEDAVDKVTREFRFNISLLTERLVLATAWLANHRRTQRLRIGYFGASTGAAAALAASIHTNQTIKAVVSRGGRPDLAGSALPRVSAPTLLIVGGNDYDVIQLNRDAQLQMGCITQLSIVPGASHLFSEPGALEQVADLARKWFVRYL